MSCCSCQRYNIALVQLNLSFFLVFVCSGNSSQQRRRRESRTKNKIEGEIKECTEMHAHRRDFEK